MPDVLILGGTGEARELAAVLLDCGVHVVSSLAGRVRDPRLPVGGVRIGGFGGSEGLAHYLRENSVRVVVDATHPFAARITSNAVSACAAAGIACLRLARAPWTAGPSDQWTHVPDVDAAAAVVAERGRRVFLTTGRQDAAAFAGIADVWFLIRVVDVPDTALPPHHELLRSRGPYTLECERELLERNSIDLLVTKNSGGDLTSAKLTAAAERGIEVVVVDRPREPAGIMSVSTVDDAATRVRALLRVS